MLFEYRYYQSVKLNLEIINILEHKRCLVKSHSMYTLPNPYPPPPPPLPHTHTHIHTSPKPYPPPHTHTYTHTLPLCLPPPPSLARPYSIILPAAAHSPKKQLVIQPLLVGLITNIVIIIIIIHLYSTFSTRFKGAVYENRQK